MSDLAHPAPGRPDPGAAGALLAGLFEQHGRTVYGLCRLLLRDADEAEDAAQQSFLSAYRALRSGVVPRDPGAWLATIARNECRNRVRVRMREPLALEPQLLAGESLDDAVARSEQVTELKAALLELPDKQREAVLLRDVYGLGYGEIAAALGATRPSVEALLFRARRRLQGRLRPLRDAAAALLVPAPLRDALAEAIPGFATGGGGAAGAAAGLTAANLVTATLLVGGAGTTVAVVGSAERAHHVPSPPAAVERAVTPVHHPPRRVVIAAVPVATRSTPRAQRELPAHDARAKAALAAMRDDEDDQDDDKAEDRRHERLGDSSGPGSATGVSSSRGRGRGAEEKQVKVKEKKEKKSRSGPSAEDDRHRIDDEDEDDDHHEGGGGGGADD
jgi:RNA polymerase sigma-70 factor (ECF subfamily)